MKKFYLLFMMALPLASFAGTDKTTDRKVSADSAECYAEQQVTVCGKVYGYYYNTKINGSPTFLDMGASYPNSTFTVLIGGNDLPKFNYDLQCLVNNDVCFTGVVTVYNNMPEMMIADPVQIAMNRKFDPAVASIQRGKSGRRNNQ